MHATPDTIAAVSSPPGASMRGVIRVSGGAAMDIVAARFRPCDGSALDAAPGHRRVRGEWLLEGDLAAPATAYVFRAPRSYTREDIVELHLPGSPGLLALVMDSLLAAGARAAQPGEFTARAFRHGAMDLAAAAGIAAMIHARSDAQLRAARRMADGSLGREAAAAREALLDVRALVEAALDFADEDVEFVSPADLAARLEAITADLRRTVASSARAERLTEPLRVVLAGPPNAGKSRLMNRLTGLDRAICSPLAGTTRDVLAAPLRLPHGEVLLCDTAGVERSSECDVGFLPPSSVAPNQVANAPPPCHAGAWQGQAVRHARSAVRDADLVIWVCDVASPTDVPAGLRGRAVCVLNKCDVIDEAAGSAAVAAWTAKVGEPPLQVSARTGLGCAALLAEIEARLHTSTDDADRVVLSSELRAALVEALTCVDRAITLARQSSDALEQAELVAAELSDAARGLGRLAGEMETDELYDRIFQRFCVGK